MHPDQYVCPSGLPQAALHAQVEEVTSQLAAAQERIERLEELIVQVSCIPVCDKMRCGR